MRHFKYLFLAAMAALLFACHGTTDRTIEKNPTRTDPVGGGGDKPSFELPIELGENQAVVFFKRDGGDYAGWGLHLWNSDSCSALADSALEGVAWETPKAEDGIDPNYGAYYVLDLNSTAGCFNFIIHQGDNKAVSQDDLVFNLSRGRVLLADEINSTIEYPQDPTAALPIELKENQAAVFYKRDDGDYTDWGLHLWNSPSCSSLADSTLEGVVWEAPKLADGTDASLGAYYVLDLADSRGCFNFIIHKGDEKAIGDGDLVFELSEGNVLFTSHGSSEFTYSGDKAEALVALANASAHWVDQNTLVWNDAADAAKVELRYSSDGSIAVDAGAVTGGMVVSASAGTLSSEAAEKFPHIATWPALQLDIDDATAMMALKGQVVALAYDANDELLAATHVQTPGVLDALYATDEALGVVMGEGETQFKVWAPTATALKLHLWDTEKNAVEGYPVDMTATDGVWLHSTTADVSNYFYKYEITAYHYASGQVETTMVTDPYSVSLSQNSELSQVLDLSSESTKPEAWDTHMVPTVDSVEETVVYELHIRDFSASDNTVPAELRGKYLAFTQEDSAGVTHIKGLQEAGLNHIHLLPTFDITSINEDASKVINLDNTVDELCQVKADAAICAGASNFVSPITLAENQAAVFYKRDDAVYTDWGLHLWNSEECNALAPSNLEGVEWATPKLPTGVDATYGAYFVLDIVNTSCINFILHKGDEKALGEANSQMDLSEGLVTLTNHGNASLIYPSEGEAVADFRTLREALEETDPTTAEAQAIMNDIRSLDSFNWGYDPYHYTVPEGSYATNPEGATRVVEFRQMVQAMHEMGLRVVMDVVYNHTSSSGLNNTSVLDKVVPGYYHRRNEVTGNIERSSCCENTASEHDMMEKLMIDSLVVWARDYKIDGFRFDLMGHHMVRNMEKALAAVQAVDADNYFYGEAWNFGEVESGRRGENAIQRNIAGTGIGTFNDRIRDAVRGGGPFDSAQALRSNQGFGTGLYWYPNDLNTGSDEEKANLLTRADWIRVSLAGTLKNYPHVDAQGEMKLGSEIDYNGQEAGYTADPQEVINYISKHDNQTLWDNLQYKAPMALSSRERTRMHNFALSVPMLSQGPLFLHMGVDLLRSKSMQRDSFDSGDWFNAVDFSGMDNNWNKGLPREDKDGGNFDVIKSILPDLNANPSADDIALAKAVFKEWLQIRSSSPLFTLGTEQEIIDNVNFLNTGAEQVPGLIVMHITDGGNIDPNFQELVVVFNASNVSQTVALENAASFSLHMVQQDSADDVLSSASADENGLTAPALSTSVFVIEEPDA